MTLILSRFLAVLLLTVLLPATALAATPVAEPRLRFDFREIPLADVARVMATESGRNIVITDKAGAIRINVFLQDVTVPEALDAIARISGISYRMDDKTGIVRLMTVEEYQRDLVSHQNEQTRMLTLRNSNVVAAANALAALFGPRVKLTAPAADSGTDSGGGSASTAVPASSATAAPAIKVPLTASEVANAVSLDTPREARERAEQRLLQTQIAPPPLHVTYNHLHNLLILRSADSEALSEAEKLVQEMDKPTRQVLLEMQILEVSLSEGFQSAVDIGLVGSSSQSPPPVGHATNPLLTTSTDGRNFVLGLGNFPLAGGTAVFQYMNDKLLSRLQLAASENRVRVLATPLLLASNNQRAKLFIGEERVLTTNVTANTVTNANQTLVSFSAVTEKRNVGNTLSVLPRINADRTVTLSIQQDASTVLPKSTTIPVGTSGNIQAFPIDTVSTANLDVTVVARDGLSVAVGGMIRERKGKGETKVPLLGDLPLLGVLFKRQEDILEKSQMLLLIRAHILDTPEDTERARARVEALTGENLNAPLQLPASAQAVP